MYKLTITSLFSLSIVLLSSNFAEADHGFDRVVANNTGRCWRIVNRDFIVKGNAHSGIMFKFTSVAGTGQTDDQINFELTIKEDYVDGVGWDESKTQTFTGTGLVKTIGSGRVYFEFYVDTGNGSEAVQAYYHPGNTMSDADDRIVLNLPGNLIPAVAADPCSEHLEEAGTL